MKVYIMSGISGSGKSYWLVHNAKGEIISRDNIRLSLLTPTDHYFDKEDEVLKIYKNMIENAARKGKDFYIDASHLTKKARRITLSWIKKFNAEVICLYFEPNLDKAIYQDNLRTGRRHVTEEVIRKQVTWYEIPTVEEGFSKVIKL